MENFIGSPLFKTLLCMIYVSMIFFLYSYGYKMYTKEVVRINIIANIVAFLAILLPHLFNYYNQ